MVSPPILRRNKQRIRKPSEISRFQRVLVRVTRFERAISTSQMWRGTSSATPGYSILSYYTTPQAKIKVFPVCGQLCGQSQFSARFADPVRPRKRPCHKAFRASAFLVVDGARATPKAGALPTALHPVI